MQRVGVLMASALAVSQPMIAYAESGNPVDVQARYLADVLHVARGGLATGTKYIDEFQLNATVASESLGWSGGRFFVYGQANTAGNFGSVYAGEFQKVSNIDTRPAVHLFEAWYDQTFMGDRLSVRAGLYDLNSEFDADPPAKLFLQSSHGIGVDIGQTGRNGPSIFPVTSLAARLAWREDGLQVQAAILDGVPGDPADQRRTAIKLGHGDGALMIGEVGYQWDRIQIATGAWGYTAKFDDLLAITPSGDPQQRGGNRGAYAFANARAVGKPGERGLDLFVRVGTAQSAVNTVSTFIGAGAVFQGPFSGRPKDNVGLAVAVAETGGAYRAAVRRDGGLAAARETAFEVTYRIEVAPWFVIQPDVQLVINPGFDPLRRRTLIVGARFEINPLAVRP